MCPHVGLAEEQALLEFPRSEKSLLSSMVQNIRDIDALHIAGTMHGAEADKYYLRPSQTLSI